ncbi:hypothetical protein ABZ345_47400 [Lentzea sp. NPDC005914]|uniref:hypothetical protein n=1 Tax=Lentzea sp. NPDC005914 TaxID=3154572 RepID=UPI0033C1D7B5
MRKDKPHASTVLRPKLNGRHSVNLYGAISCARVYRTGAQHLADVVAADLSQKLNWSSVPKFELETSPSS